MSELSGHIETMYAFWAGELSESDQQTFQEKLDRDTELLAEYQTYQFLFEAFRQIKAENFEEQAHLWEQDLENQSPESEQKRSKLYSKSLEVTESGLKTIPALDMENKVKNWESSAQAPKERNARPSGTTKMRRLMARFAVAASIILMGYWSFSYWATQQWSDQAYADAAMELPSGLRSTTGGSELSVIDAMSNALKSEQYKTAIELSRSVEKTDSLYAETQYLAGHAYFKTREYIAAARAFNMARLVPDQKGINYELTEYKQYLSFLAAGDPTGIESTQKLILSKPGHAYLDEITELEEKRVSLMRLLFVQE